ncbi:MAG: DUF6391 domain-containing protein [Chloroflexota bacterium]
MNLWEMVQRNHGLEHATISLLLARVQEGSVAGRPLAGYSVPGGFIVVGDLPSEAIEDAAAQGLARMQAGEGHLAVSPFCGTNIVVTAGLTSLGAVAGYRLAGQGLAGMMRAFTNAAMGIVAAQPLGRWVQSRYTTSPDVGAMRIEGVSRLELGPLTVHWVATSFEG